MEMFLFVLNSRIIIVKSVRRKLDFGGCELILPWTVPYIDKPGY